MFRLKLRTLVVMFLAFNLLHLATARSFEEVKLTEENEIKNREGTMMAKGSELLAEESDSFFPTPCSVYKEEAQNFILQRCKAGTTTFEKLYNKALSFFYSDTRRQDCLEENLRVEFLSAVENAAKREGWYSNCLLNSPLLLALVCHTHFQGYSDSTAIIGQLRNPDLTADMVLNFLTRCPEPPITPIAKAYTCIMFCDQVPISKIAATVVLKEYQVRSIIETCPTCKSSDS